MKKTSSFEVSAFIFLSLQSSFFEWGKANHKNICFRIYLLLTMYWKKGEQEKSSIKIKLKEDTCARPRYFLDKLKHQPPIMRRRE